MCILDTRISQLQASHLLDKSGELSLLWTGSPVSGSHAAPVARMRRSLTGAGARWREVVAISPIPVPLSK